MYIAELHGKLSSRVEKMEDILTSNVFSFFKYSKRNVFLKGYLRMLGLDVSGQECSEAEFIFWPVYDDYTEPDLVIIVGNYYLLIEAKYFSGFGSETTTTKSQLIREFKNGKLEADNYGKVFRLIAITVDYYFKKEKFDLLQDDDSSHLIWTKWHSVASFLNTTIDSNENLGIEERAFALDLCHLLDKKNLRGYQAILIPSNKRLYNKVYTSLFFESETARFRGVFVGFIKSLATEKKILPRSKELFFGILI